jgi:thiol-disulfide isomerase/thioredoxin
MAHKHPHRGIGKSILLISSGVIIGVGLGVVILFGFGMGNVWFERSNFQGIAPAVPGIKDQASDFELQDLSGKPVKLSDFRGIPVLINFWATWCGPCRVEMPILQEYYRRYNPDFVVLAVNIDESRDTVQSFVDEYQLEFPVLLDKGGKVTDSYHVRGFPTSIFVDRDGNIRYQHIGGLSEEVLVGYLEDLGVVQ